MASPVVTSEADNVVALQRRDETFTTLDVASLVPTTRLLLERLVTHAPEEKAYDDLGAALVAARVAAHNARGQIIPLGSWGLLADLYGDVATLVSDLTYTAERDTQRTYLGDGNLGDIRYSADAALAAETEICAQLDRLSEVWLGL